MPLFSARSASSEKYRRLSSSLTSGIAAHLAREPEVAELLVEPDAGPAFPQRLLEGVEAVRVGGHDPHAGDDDPLSHS